MTAEEVRALLQEKVREAGTVVGWSKEHGVSPGYTHEVLRNTRHPAGKILEALGLEKIVTYQPLKKD